ncbi:hypothetical protein MN608_06986 [Microdochium nivale]|nr:hypothetical protein MN608_06986 [Microdochium nivale]
MSFYETDLTVQPPPVMGCFAANWADVYKAMAIKIEIVEMDEAKHRGTDDADRENNAAASSPAAAAAAAPPHPSLPKRPTAKSENSFTKKFLIRRATEYFTTEEASKAAAATSSSSSSKKRSFSAPLRSKSCGSIGPRKKTASKESNRPSTAAAAATTTTSFSTSSSTSSSKAADAGSITPKWSSLATQLRSKSWTSFGVKTLVSKDPSRPSTASTTSRPEQPSTNPPEVRQLFIPFARISSHTRSLKHSLKQQKQPHQTHAPPPPPPSTITAAAAVTSPCLQDLFAEPHRNGDLTRTSSGRWVDEQGRTLTRALCRHMDQMTGVTLPPSMAAVDTYFGPRRIIRAPPQPPQTSSSACKNRDGSSRSRRRSTLNRTKTALMSPARKLSVKISSPLYSSAYATSSSETSPSKHRRAAAKAAAKTECKRWLDEHTKDLPDIWGACRRWIM